MKYLMGLILAFVMGVSAFAQETQQNQADMDQCVQACLDKHSDTGMDQQNLNNQDQSKEKKEPCPEGEAGTERYEEGSVYYHEDPELRESLDEESSEANIQMDTVDVTGEVDANAEIKAEEEETTDVTSEIREGAEDVGEGVVEGAEKVGGEVKEVFTDEEEDTSMSTQSNLDADLTPTGGLWKMANQCALHKELEERSGAFKITKDMGNAELKVERERDGEEKLKFESDTEVYSYEKNEKGQTEYYYSITKDNEMIEYIKGRDGMTDVIYHGVFDSPEEANNAVEAGIDFEGFSSVCSQ